MHSNYTVSILVTVFREERYIERCARSLFEQTYADLEYIFVDDGSKDASIAILERVIKEYPAREESVRIIRHAGNRGLAAARNTAFDHARGEFVCVVDADDWLPLDAVERMVDEQVATGADVVWGKALMHTEKGEIELKEPCYKDVEEWRQCYFRFTTGLVMVNWRRIIRRSLLEENHIRHEEGKHIGNDKQLMPLIAYYAQSFSSVDAIVYHYERRNPEASTYKDAHGEYVLLKSTREIESMRRIVRFLADKEPGYLDTAQYAKLERLLKYRKDALVHASREGFRKMVGWIWETPAGYRKRYGWGSHSLKTILKSNYEISRLLYLTKRAVNRLKKQRHED